MKLIEILDTTKTTFYIEYPFRGEKAPQDVYAWLDKTDGAGFSFGDNGIYFYKEQDATMFALRWL